MYFHFSSTFDIDLSSPAHGTQLGLSFIVFFMIPAGKATLRESQSDGVFIKAEAERS
jgi:hypothetical protein